MAGYFMCSKIEEMVTIALPRVSNPPIRLKKGIVHRQTALKDVIRELACFAHLLRTSGSGLSLVTWEFAGGPQPAEGASLTLSGSSVELPGGTTTGPTGKRGASGHFCSCRLVVLASFPDCGHQRQALRDTGAGTRIQSSGGLPLMALHSSIAR